MAARKKPSSEVSCTGDSEPPNGPMMMAAKPATTEAMTQLAAARNSGEYPRRTAPFSLPAAARVAMPKRV